MKKIALNYIYLSPKHAGGKDQVGLNLLKGFYELGYTKDIFVICYSYSTNVIKQIAPDINIIEIPAREDVTELLRLIKICFTNTFIIPRIIKKHNIELVYHLSCNTGLRKLKATSVVIPHDIKAVSHRVLANVKIPMYKYIFYRVLYYNDFKNNDYIISISETDKKEISRYYPKFKEKIKRIYNPIDVDIKPVHSRTEVGNYIVALNLQFHHKNIITLIKAFEIIKDKIDANLILIGNVPARMNYLKEYVKEHNLDNRIIFTGFVSQEEKQKLFQHCKLYVNPTLYEGFGMTAVESIVFMIPTLVSKIDTNYEITKGLCDYYYPPEDENILAEKLIQCLDKEYDYNELKKNSNEIYKEYNYLKISQEYIDFFDNCK